MQPPGRHARWNLGKKFEVKIGNTFHNYNRILWDFYMKAENVKRRINSWSQIDSSYLV